MSAFHRPDQALTTSRGEGAALGGGRGSLADGTVVAQTLNTQGLLVSLDHLGESVTNAAEADRAVSAYLEAIEALANEEVEGNVSLKLTQLGLDLSHELCVANMRRILNRARELDTFVRIDMESSAYTQRTLEVHQELWEAGFRNVGTVLQAYLYRTAADVQRAIEMGVPVRLCKGAYLEPSRVAYADKAAVDANYARLMEQLLLHGNHPAIATHDLGISCGRYRLSAKTSRPSDSTFEMPSACGATCN